MVSIVDLDVEDNDPEADRKLIESRGIVTTKAPENWVERVNDQVLLLGHRYKEGALSDNDVKMGILHLNAAAMAMVREGTLTVDQARDWVREMTAGVAQVRTISRMETIGNLASKATSYLTLINTVLVLGAGPLLVGIVTFLYAAIDNLDQVLDIPSEDRTWTDFRKAFVNATKTSSKYATSSYVVENVVAPVVSSPMVQSAVSKIGSGVSGAIGSAVSGLLGY